MEILVYTKSPSTLGILVFWKSPKSLMDMRTFCLGVAKFQCKQYFVDACQTTYSGNSDIHINMNECLLFLIGMVQRES